MSWTHFMDMHSGGRRKLDWEHIFIEAPEAEAKAVFFNRFKRNPERVTCTCCGGDYSISTSETLEQATAYERNCQFDKDSGRYLEQQDESRARIRRDCDTPEQNPWGKYVTLAEYVKSGSVKVIPASEIGPDERKADIPDEGYVWAGG